MSNGNGHPKEKLVIVRRTTAAGATRDVLRGNRRRSIPMAAADDDEPATASVDVDEVARQDIPRLTRDRDVIAVAPAMPMRLIAPRDEGPAAAPAAPTGTWGVRAVGADTSPFTGNGIVVAVLDTGIDAGHPAFAGVNIVARNFTSEAPTDLHGHGTHCAGTIFGRPVGGTRIGVAPGVTKAVIGKVLGAGGGSSEQIASAIVWALDEGAHVISMSLGIDFPGYVQQLKATGIGELPAVSRALEGYRANVQLFERLAEFVQAHGAMAQPTVIVAAAGNESGRDATPPFEVAVSPPAVAPGIISVAALGQNGQGFTVAPFSNTGANVAGPGVGIVSAARGGGLRTMSGTSMATPHVAGVAALWAERIRSAGPLNAGVLTARLVASASRTGLQSPVDAFDVGEGLVRAPQS